MTATKKQPIAGYRISDPSDPTIKPWLSDTPDDNGYTSEPLYAGAAPAAVAPQGERQWICPTRTVADLANNLLTMDQALPIYGAQYIEKDGRRCAIAVPPTVSRERVQDGRWIGQGEELNAAVVWTRAEQPVAAPGLTDGQLDDESYRVNDEPGFADAFRAGARFAERVHGVTASAARAVTGKADWWRGRADEIEAQVARSGSSEAMRCYTDMRTLLQAAAAPQAPNCTRCSGSGEDPEGYLTHGRGPDDHTVDGPCRSCDGTGAAPQAPAAPAVDAFTHAELLEIKRAVEEFADCNETDVDYALLLRAAQAGYLECTQFHVLNQSALDLDTVAAAQAKEGGA